MNNYTKYLHLKVTNGSLIVSDIPRFKYKFLPTNVIKRLKELELEHPDTKFYVFGGCDIANPFYKEELSNMLRAMMGFKTVSTKPIQLEKIHPLARAKRPLVFDEMAQTAHYHIDTYIDSSCYVERVIGTDGEYYNIYKSINSPSRIGGAELIKGAKSAYDSNVKGERGTTVFYNPDGSEWKRLAGIYDHMMLRRYFKDNDNDPLFLKIKGFINEILGCKNCVKEYSFINMAYAIHMYKNTSEEALNKVNDFVQSIKKDWEMVAKKQKGFSSYPVWMQAIFDYGKITTSSNLTVNGDGLHSVTYVREQRDVSRYRIPVYGDIIIKVTDPRIEDLLRESGGLATILDSGACTIEALTDFEPVPNYEEKWRKAV